MWRKLAGHHTLREIDGNYHRHLPVGHGTSTQFRKHLLEQRTSVTKRRTIKTGKLTQRWSVVPCGDEVHRELG